MQNAFAMCHSPLCAVHRLLLTGNQRRHVHGRREMHWMLHCRPGASMALLRNTTAGTDSTHWTGRAKGASSFVKQFLPFHPFRLRFSLYRRIPTWSPPRGNLLLWCIPAVVAYVVCMLMYRKRARLSAQDRRINRHDRPQNEPASREAESAPHRTVQFCFSTVTETCANHTRHARKN